MEEIDQRFQAGVSKIKDFTIEQIQCLETFAKCDEMVKWTQDSVEGKLMLTIMAKYE